MGKRSGEEHGYENRVRELRQAQDISAKVLAERIGTTESQIARLERGTRELSLTWMRRIAGGLGCSVPELLTPEDLYPPYVPQTDPEDPEGSFAFVRPSAPFRRPWPIPLWGAGASYSPNGCVYFDADFLDENSIDPFRCVVIETRDASMEPTLAGGSVCLVDRRYSALVEDELCAFLLPGGEPTIRRLEAAGKRWVLRADNKAFRDRLYEEAMSSIGLVLWTSRMTFDLKQLSRAQAP